MTTLSRPHGYGDSDLCKQDPSHGATYSTVRGDWCPHSGHRGDQFTNVSTPEDPGRAPLPTRTRGTSVRTSRSAPSIPAPVTTPSRKAEASVRLVTAGSRTSERTPMPEQLELQT